MIRRLVNWWKHRGLVHIAGYWLHPDDPRVEYLRSWCGKVAETPQQWFARTEGKTRSV